MAHCRRRYPGPERAHLSELGVAAWQSSEPNKTTSVRMLEAIVFGISSSWRRSVIDGRSEVAQPRSMPRQPVVKGIRPLNEALNRRVNRGRSFTERALGESWCDLLGNDRLAALVEVFGTVDRCLD